MKTIVLLAVTALLLTGCTSTQITPKGNLSDEMKIPYAIDLSSDDGADSVERDGDHQSAYFSTIDFYNLASKDGLTILPKFKTLQQTSEWSCGPASLLMVLNHFNRLGDFNEQSLSALRPQGDKPGASSLGDMIAIFEGVGGFTLESAQDYDTYDALGEAFTLDAIQAYLKEGLPILIGWNDWGGHWQAIIGYDTMGTETAQDDVIIVADPYDTTDHNQDGYGVYGAERFIYNFTFYNFFDEEDGENNNVMQFLVARPLQ